MKAKLNFVAIAATVLSGCSTVSVYERVSEQLVESRYTSVCCGYVGHWLPLGQAHFGGIPISSEELTEEQVLALKVSIDTCISKLNEEYVGVNAALATSQLLECMRTKGWSHGFSEFATTS
jgi:hypothetical protein